MPQKGGGGQTPPNDAESEDVLINTDRGGPGKGQMDRAGKEDEFEFVYGDIVWDREPEEPQDAVVVNLPDVPASEWEVKGGTLADQNPGCPPDDDVVIVVVRSDLDEYLSDWDERTEEIPLEQLDEDDISYLPYPSLRLDLVEESHLR